MFSALFNWFEKRINPYPELTAPHPQAAIPSRQFWAFVRYSTHGVRWALLLTLLFTAAIGMLEALLFGFLGQIIDWLADVPPQQLWQQEGHKLLLIGVAIVLIPVFSGLQSLVKYQALAGNFPMRLRWVYHRLMLDQSMAFYQDEFSGRVATKVMQTALAVRDMCFIFCDVMIFVVVYFSTLVAVVGSFNAWMLVPFAVWLLCYFGMLRYFIPRLAEVSQNQSDARSLMTGRIVDAYANINTVKLFAHTGREAGYAKLAMREFMTTVYRQMRLVTKIDVTNDSLNMTLVASTCLLALWLWTQDQMTVGAVAAATAMTLRLNGMAHWVMWELTGLFEQVGTVRDGINMLSKPNDVLDAPDAQPLDVQNGAIAFDNITFEYGDGRAVIHDLNLHLKPGEKVGLVGPSGAGKSTLTNLLLRFYDLQTGSIAIDGQNIAHVTQDSLRQAIGMVTQDTSLLHRSIADNILYGKPNATQADVEHAAQRAQAHEFIQTLQDSKGRAAYDAHVGERGVKLSGGQRQRIAIARVMLKDAPILLLDEATSALDSEIETAIQSNLYELMEGKTVLAIAHRLSTIAAMDRLIVMDNGRIVEEGSHDELITQGGLYAKLWQHQSGGFLGEV